MELRVEETDGLQIVRVTGELDTFAVQSFSERLSVLRNSDRFVVDLGALSFIDSAGLHALFSVSRVAKDVGARIVFVVPPESPVRRVIDLVQLAEITPVCESSAAAIAHLPGIDAER